MTRNEENLIPSDISKMENHLEISSKGGEARSEAKTLSNYINASKQAKCKNCTVQCYLKKNLLEQDSESYCPIPEARARAMFYGTPVIHPLVFQKLGMDALGFMLKHAVERNDPKLMMYVHKGLMEQQRVFEGIGTTVQYVENQTNNNQVNFIGQVIEQMKKETSRFDEMKKELEEDKKEEEEKKDEEKPTE